MILPQHISIQIPKKALKVVRHHHIAILYSSGAYQCFFFLSYSQLKYVKNWLFNAPCRAYADTFRQITSACIFLFIKLGTKWFSGNEFKKKKSFWPLSGCFNDFWHLAMRIPVLNESGLIHPRRLFLRFFFIIISVISGKNYT